MDAFYRAFEERFRGSRELIKSRLEVYLPFVEPLKKLYETPEILDLGCGRGEWLELMQLNDFQAKGVDLNEGMLLACRELKLDVYQADALDYIRGLASDRLSVVSAFHFVEHISFESLRQLVDEAFRVLKPGGLLILETPNSENLVVGTSSFYLDPSHQRPLPAQLLSFVAEYEGFTRVKTLYLQDSLSLATVQKNTLINVLHGVSPDYAVIAQKKASEDVIALFDEPFKRSYGLRLSTLAERYDQQTGDHAQRLQNEWGAAQQKIEELGKRTGQLEITLAAKQTKAINLAFELNAANEHITQLQTHAQWLQNELNAVNAKIHELNQSSHHHWWTMADSLNQELKALYASRSWLITKPLRLSSLAVKKIINGILTIPKGLWFAFKFPFKLMLASLIRFILKRPKLKARAIAKLRKHPRLEAHLCHFASLRGIALEAMGFTCSVNQNISAAHAVIDTDMSHMPPRARRIYADLKAAIENHSEENS
jgi:O-antigen chain-terminating methyltransferase